MESAGDLELLINRRKSTDGDSFTRRSLDVIASDEDDEEEEDDEGEEEEDDEGEEEGSGEDGSGEDDVPAVHFGRQAANHKYHGPVGVASSSFVAAQPARAERAERVMSHADVLEAKKDMLCRLDRLEKRGYRLPRKHSMSSDVAEMRMDIERVVSDRDLEASVRFQKTALMTVVSGLELLNTNINPFNAHLEGWSETVNVNITDYDEVMEELHFKYRGRGKMVPELKLLLMITGSAFMYHVTNTMFAGLGPGVGKQVMRENPDLMRQMASATAKHMAGSGGAHSSLASLLGEQFSSGAGSGDVAGGGGGGMRGPRSGTIGSGGGPSAAGAPHNAPSIDRTEELLRFMSQQDAQASSHGAVPAPAVRPPMPKMTQKADEPRVSAAAAVAAHRPASVVAAPPSRQAPPKPARRRAAVQDDIDLDLVEIMSSAGTSAPSSGSRRQRNTIVLR